MIKMRKILYIVMIYMIYSVTAPMYVDAYNWEITKGRNGNPAQAGEEV